MKRQLSILFCLGFTAAVLSACESSYGRYDNAGLYEAGDFSYAAADVKEIEIDWSGGSIEIQQCENDTLSAFENARLKSNTAKMHHYLDGDTLKIEYCASGYQGKIGEEDKNLQLEIPKGIDLHIETKNAPVSIGSIEVRSLSIESHSGDITGEKWIVETDVEIETVSGFVSVGELQAQDLDFDGKSGGLSIERCDLRQIDGETTSGAIKLGVVGECIGSLETTSGNVTLRLGEEGGLSVRFKSFAGELKTEREYQKDNRYLFVEKNEENLWQIGVDTISGNLFVE